MSYAKRFEDVLLQEISDRINKKSENLVTNRMSGMDGMARALEAEYQRGGIAELREISIMIQREIPKKLNEETK